MESKELINVLLADDQTMIRQGFGYVIGLQNDMKLIGEASKDRTQVVVTALRNGLVK